MGCGTALGTSGLRFPTSTFCMITAMRSPSHGGRPQKSSIAQQAQLQQSAFTVSPDHPIPPRQYQTGRTQRAGKSTAEIRRQAEECAPPCPMGSKASGAM